MVPRLLLLLAVLSLARDVAAEDRFALVIGNGKYAGAAALRNPPNDAAAVAAVLEKLDFKVTKKTDADLASLEKAVLAFRKSLPKKSIALFFYAGHGLQVKGENFLVPVDADVQEESQVKRKCLPVDEVLNELDASSAALKVVILDSCRDNPLTRSWSRSTGSGLASIAQVPDGTIIAFSTAPGKVALDGRGTNSPFTKHLVASFDRRPAEGLELIDALRATGQAVSKEIGQRPWLNFDTSLEDFYLWRDMKLSATPKTMPTPEAEEPLSVPRNLKRIDHPEDSKFETVENTIGMKFVVVPAGEFLMGSPEDENGWDASSNEKPQHRVKISQSLYFGMYEVTLGQFLRFYHDAKYKTDAEKDDTGGGGFSGDPKEPFKFSREFVPWTTGFKQTMDHPVVNVSWNDAQAFCKWLSDKEGQKYRLPTEAEWEYACRGGTKTRYWIGNNNESLAEIANFFDAEGRTKMHIAHYSLNVNDGFAFSAPVGSFRPNPFGLYDMHGNACEWCQDGYQRNAYKSRSDVTLDPLMDMSPGPALRGGSFESSYLSVRSGSRNGAHPSYRKEDTGFRVVLPKTQ